MAKSTENAVENAANITEEKEQEINYIDIRDRDGKTYRLEFNRRISEAMEREGFVFDMDNKPQTTIRTLFRGAFRMHHKGIMPEKTDAIWDFQRDKGKLIAYLYNMYLKPLNDLLNEPEGEADENPTWSIG